MIINCGNTDVILTVNNSNFVSTYANIYDEEDCPCTVLVSNKKCDNEHCIHLLRKSGQANFYENFLNCCSPLMQSCLVLEYTFQNSQDLEFLVRHY